MVLTMHFIAYAQAAIASSTAAGNWSNIWKVATDKGGEVDERSIVATW